MQFDLPTILTALASLASGFGLKGVWTYLSKRNAQDHQEELDWADRVMDRLDVVEERLDTTEQELQRSQMAEARLSSQVQTLIGRINLLLDRLEMHEEIDDEERIRYTRIPGKRE